MSNRKVLLGILVILNVTGLALANDDNVWQRETLTDGFWGLNDKLADSGVEVGLGLTSIYQKNTKGGTGTNQTRGRHTGSYDLEVSADMQKLLGIEGGTLFLHGEGSWPHTDLDATSIGKCPWRRKR